MKKTNNKSPFEGYNIKQLRDMKTAILSVETKEELLSMIDDTLSKKEEEQKTSMNAR